ncbi:MAG: chloramphenicol acetyltransferase CAT [Cellulosilyticum sp.]|nr:chloramphenicol acetyltransferase CAT [Cellulosilyticum sp.]
MNFTLIDMENWERKECFNHFMTVAKSTYSLTVNMDITYLMTFIKQHNLRLYPTFTWIITRALNQHVEFKTCYDLNHQLGYYDEISPCYSILDDQTKIMDSMTTPYDQNFKNFYIQMTTDLDNYKTSKHKTDFLPNFFLVSCLPWLSYTSFDVNNQSDYDFLLPMVTWGKYFEQQDKILMPLTLQVHHAVCDGYHCSLFYKDVETVLAHPEHYLI